MKEQTSTSETYQGLDLTKNTKAFVVEDVHFQFYIFESMSHCHIVKEAIHKSWAGLDKFLDENKETTLAYHENFFKVNPPKKQDLIKTAQYIWAKIVSIAVDRRPTASTTPGSNRKSTISKCVYSHGDASLADPNTEALLKTPQSKICLKFVRTCLTTSGETDLNKQTVTEEILRQYVIDHATELHTRQDPWRIFQYYRPQLISEKLIRRN